jgi:OOP family OmpA-OmpF porin
LGPLLERELELDAIEREGREGGGAEAPAARSRRPFLIAMAVLALLLLGWLVRNWWWAQRVETLRAAFAAWPGLVVERIDSRPFRSVHVRGLLDALAESPDALAARAPWKDYRFDFELRGFVSADPAIVERRARALLDPPASVHVAVHAGRLELSGTAPSEWIAQARDRAAFVPGVSGVDLGSLMRSGPSEREQQLAGLEALVRKLEAGEVVFVDETEPSAEGRDALARMGGELRNAQELAGLLGKTLRVRAIGLTDEVGTDPYNEALRGRRAQWLATQLAGAAGRIDIAPADAALAQASATLRRRAARLSIAVEDSAAP